MVNVSAIAHAEQLLAQGWSYREIMDATGLASGTIRSIRTGKITAEERGGPRLTSLVASRCPGCGGKQIQPCLVCHIRTMGRMSHDAA